jgi:hypothetical protein
VHGVVHAVVASGLVVLHRAAVPAAHCVHRVMMSFEDAERGAQRGRLDQNECDQRHEGQTAGADNPVHERRS